MAKGSRRHSRRRSAAKRGSSAGATVAQEGKQSLILKAADVIAAPGRWAADVVDRYEELFLLAGLFAYAAAEWQRVGRRFWFDELFTFHIARLPSLTEMLRAAPADGNPPLYYLLADLSMTLFRETEFAARLPALLAFLTALLATYLFVRRRSGGALALMAMLALAVSDVAGYGSEARPYTLLLAFTGITLVSWQRAAEGHRKALIGVALGIAGAIASHHYGIFHVGVPLMFGEMVRLVRRRRLDLWMYVACAAGFSVLVFTAPLARESRRVMGDHVLESTVFWAKPSFQSFHSYGNMFVSWLPVVFAVLFLLTMASYRHRPASEDSRSELLAVPLHEISAVLGLALMLPVMLGVTWLLTGYFLDRYAIGTGMGLAMLVGLAPLILRLNRRQAAAIASVCAVLLTVQLAERFAESPLDEGETLLDAATGKEPIVVASALLYAREWWYAPSRLRERLHYLADVDYAVQQPDFLPEVSLVADQPFVPSKVDDYQQFLDNNRSFLLYSMGNPNVEWVKERLEKEGWQLNLIERRGAETLYRVAEPQ